VSKYRLNPLEFDNLKTVSPQARGGQVKVGDFARPYEQGAGLKGWLDSLPRILAGDALRGEPKHGDVPDCPTGSGPAAASGGRGFAITGHHELTIPLLAAILAETDS
jgi:hypothetical protein